MRVTGSVFLLLVGATNALAPSKMNRRNFFGVVSGSASAFVLANNANAAALKTGAASPFTGDYDDPNHPGCLRQVKVVGAPLKGDGTRSAYPVVEVVGWDGKEGAKACTERPNREQLWKVDGKIKNNAEALIDFSSKGGPKDLLAKYADGGIVFPDGNKWTKVIAGTNTRRPKDMTTLKSD
eukprot:CAMPEP_0194199986 /NCGR_PEP_ID=MMETSP0156-20130528/791_1 /TAXON_ID=33649 /ORGANISM="Thalassionema nitzschioides, Strain L26-B" /LENGTH=180 /DNA_ID=CAMNT_0038924943 /DNA_START=88 /DNA_END=630 /DNA_ORIENTATION=-